MDGFAVAWVLGVIILFQQVEKPAELPTTGKETIILLPDAEGKSTGIVVSSRGQEIVVTEPYQGVELSGGKVESRTYTAAQVQDVFPEVLQALPDKPRLFILRFEQNGTQLTPESAAMVDQVRQEISKRAAPEVTVIGHTDREGTDAANLRLSRERAESVRNILVKGGIAAAIIEVIGRGELEPEVATDDGVAEPRNRRVEISVR